MEIDLSTLPVQCPVCEKDMLRLNRDHALEHGYKSLTQYRKENGLDYLTLQQRSKEDFKRLYNIDFKRWVVGYHTSEGMRYVTKIYDPEIIEYTRSGSKFPINDGTFYAHMSGQNPLAVIALGTHSRYFTFDIDSEDQAKSDALKLIKQLQDHGIDRNDIHISFSGGKGYHISLFIDQHIKFKDWEMFAKYIKYKAGLTSADIEHRPIESNGLALKLPLTLHPKIG